jgi:hypothetical protein
MESAFYFKHDYNARNDQKILELRAQFGWAGYAIYFAIIEVLCESKGVIRSQALAGLALGFNMEKAMLADMVKYMIQIELLHEKDGDIYSNRVNKHIDARARLSEAGRKGGSHTKATVKPGLSQAKARPKAGEERRGDINSDINITSWRDDFEVYLDECSEAYEEFTTDELKMAEQSRLNPRVNVKLSIEKGYLNFWATKAGWEHKKKQKSKVINWPATIINSIDMNKVYFTREELAEI